MTTLIAATTADVQTIHDIAQRVWSVHYIPHIITQAQMDYMMEWMYSADSLAKQMNEGKLFWLIQHEGETAGYISISNEDGHLFLHKFYIDLPYQKLGIGSSILNQAITNFAGAIDIRLQVNRKNYKAINFYFKNGFSIERAEDFDIGNGYLMEDFVMVKRLTNS